MISSLNTEQKQAVGLLQFGTFLEYFDLMLYVHMAVLLNELFFPQSDPHTASLLAAFAFCSTFLLRPLGALIFGFIGDYMGRKTTVILTMLTMSISCIVMAGVPPYAQIGITAAWIVTICRAIQGLSSMGEIIGAEVYLTESIPRSSTQYFCVALLGVCATFGVTAALGVASLVTFYQFNWRLVFFVGAGIAVIGATARMRLRETPDFLEMKRQREQSPEETRKKDVALPHQQPNKKAAIAYFLIQCVWPIWFYLAYVHCGTILKSSFGWTAEQIIHQNFMVSMIEFLSSIIFAYLAYKFHPLRILKGLFSVFLIFVLICPYLFYKASTPFELLWLQFFIVVFAPSDFPAVAIFFRHFPVFRRFTYASVSYALSRVFMYTITSFGVVYLTEYLSHWGLWLIALPPMIGYAYGLRYFEQLENPTQPPFISFWKSFSFFSPRENKEAV